MVTANYPDDTVGVLLGNGDGTLQTAVTYESGGPYAWSTALADLDSDGKVDILVADQNGSTLGVLLAHGDGTFQAAETYSAPGQAELVATADVNGDGRPDAVVAAGGNWVDVFLNALGLRLRLWEPKIRCSPGNASITSLPSRQNPGQRPPERSLFATEIRHWRRHLCLVIRRASITSTTQRMTSVPTRSRPFTRETQTTIPALPPCLRKMFSGLRGWM